MTAPRRLSNGVPRIIGPTEMAEKLKHLPPRVELATAALFNMTVEDWRAQPAKARMKQVLDHQDAGEFAAVMAASEKAIGNLEAAALPAVPAPRDLDMDTIAASVVDLLHKQGLIIINPSTTQKGA